MLAGSTVAVCSSMLADFCSVLVVWCIIVLESTVLVGFSAVVCCCPDTVCFIKVAGSTVVLDSTMLVCSAVATDSIAVFSIGDCVGSNDCSVMVDGSNVVV